MMGRQLGSLHASISPCGLTGQWGCFLLLEEGGSDPPHNTVLVGCFWTTHGYRGLWIVQKTATFNFRLSHLALSGMLLHQTQANKWYRSAGYWTQRRHIFISLSSCPISVSHFWFVKDIKALSSLWFNLGVRGLKYPTCMNSGSLLVLFVCKNSSFKRRWSEPFTLLSSSVKWLWICGPGLVGGEIKPGLDKADFR